MSDQHPSVEDEVERALRLGLATASQMADRHARARQDLARQAQHRSEQEARQLEARYRAEGASATARLALVDRTEWWDRATPADITSMWQLAAQWQNEQPRAATAAEAIARQVRDRYGLDVRAPSVGTEAIHAAVAQLDAEQRDRASRPHDHDDAATAVATALRAEQRDAFMMPPSVEHQQMSEMQEQQSADRGVLLEFEAEQYDRQAAEGGSGSLDPQELQALATDARGQASPHHPTGGAPGSQPTYDSAERRDQTATRLSETGISPDAIAVAMRADIAHARPANEAVSTRVAPARVSGTRLTARGAQRSDRSR